MRLKMKMGTPHLGRAPQLHKCQMNASPMESQVRKKAKRSEEINRFFRLAQGALFQRAPLGLQAPLGMGPLLGLPLPPGISGLPPPPGMPGLRTLPPQLDLPALPWILMRNRKHQLIHLETSLTPGLRRNKLMVVTQPPHPIHCHHLILHVILHQSLKVLWQKCHMIPEELERNY